MHYRLIAIAIILSVGTMAGCAHEESGNPPVERPPSSRAINNDESSARTGLSRDDACASFNGWFRSLGDRAEPATRDYLDSLSNKNLSPDQVASTRKIYFTHHAAALKLLAVATKDDDLRDSLYAVSGDLLERSKTSWVPTGSAGILPDTSAVMALCNISLEERAVPTTR